MNPGIWEVLFDNHVKELQIEYVASSDEETDVILQVMDRMENKKQRKW